jgi:GTP:adenosylcobinamide-phosphate guanylyltransferase
MAAGEGRRMRPLTERFAKAVLPIDGRPVVVTLLRELASAGITRVTVVTGHLAEQVEALIGDGSSVGLALRFVRQPRPDGSADAVLRAALEPPYLVLAADTVFAAGDVRRFCETFLASGAAGAIAIRRHPDKDRVRVEDGRIVLAHDPGGPGPWTGAPLWALGDPIAPYVGLDKPPYELRSAYQRAIDAGSEIAAIEIGATRDLTFPLDLVRENFPYLTAL